MTPRSLLAFTALSYLACNDGKDTTDCIDVTGAACADVGIAVTICCTDDSTCLVGATVAATGEAVGYKSICYDGSESAGCQQAAADIESFYCSTDE